MTELRQIKTDEYTIKSGHLDVGNGHKVWFEQWGNPRAKTPVLFFHGGPGFYFTPHNKQYFDPKVHQLIGFDQRGAGNSTPYGKLEHNTTADIMSDANKILEHLGVKEIYVFGGSWGSALALLYTLQNQKRVKATIVNGVFTASRPELEYIHKGYYEQVYPEVWERFKKSAPPEHRDDPTSYHYQIIAGTTKEKIIRSSKALEEMEGPLLKFDWRGYSDTKKDKTPHSKDEEYDYIPYQIYAHYLSNGCFMEKDNILTNAHQIKTPLYIVQGRYDMCCPVITAYKIHQATPGSKLYITDGSHSPGDSANRIPLKILADSIFI